MQTCAKCGEWVSVVVEGGVCVRCAPPVVAPKCAACGKRPRFPGMTICAVCLAKGIPPFIGLLGLLVVCALSASACGGGGLPFADAAPDAAPCGGVGELCCPTDAGCVCDDGLVPGVGAPVCEVP